MVEIDIAPSNIRFTQDSIADRFSDGTTLKDTFTALVRGQLTVNGMQTMVCVKWEGKYWVIHGNRRLFLFKILEEENKIRQVKVKVKKFIEEPFMERLSTKDHGRSVFCRQNRNLYHELKQIARMGMVTLESLNIAEGSFWRTVTNNDEFEETNRRLEDINPSESSEADEQDNWSWWKCAIL